MRRSGFRIRLSGERRGGRGGGVSADKCQASFATGLPSLATRLTSVTKAIVDNNSNSGKRR